MIKNVSFAIAVNILAIEEFVVAINCLSIVIYVSDEVNLYSTMIVGFW
ncbi:MAG: hypothetical protein CM15mV65_520 [Caudoviricetes sp.]|nr:MAG: hypothetical protein CM15mV65_520 [Caudoviricetes sp.]